MAERSVYAAECLDTEGLCSANAALRAPRLTGYEMLREMLDISLEMVFHNGVRR